MLRNFSGYKSLPCRGACGCGGCGAAGGGVSASGTSCAPINALGGCARSISRCLFRRSRSVTSRNIATMHRENRKRHYTIGDTPYFRGTEWRWRGDAAHSSRLLRLHCKRSFDGNGCRESGSVIIGYAT